MTSTVLSPVSDSIDASPAQPTTRARFRRLLLTAVAAAAVVTTLAVGHPSSAEAYANWSWSGRQGSIQAPAPVVRSGFQFDVPGIWISRNGYVPAGTPQRVAVTYELQLYTTAGWKWVDRLTSTKYIQQLQSSVQMDAPRMTPRYNYSAGTGNYRVVYTVEWGGPWSAGGDRIVSGTQVFYPNTTSDMLCGVSTCRSYNGYVTVTG